WLARWRQRSMLIPSQFPSLSFIAKGGASLVAMTSSCVLVAPWALAARGIDPDAAASSTNASAAAMTAGRNLILMLRAVFFLHARDGLESFGIAIWRLRSSHVKTRRACNASPGQSACDRNFAPILKRLSRERAERSAGPIV